MSIIRDIILCIRHSAQKYDEVKEVKSNDFAHTVSEEFQGVKGALQLKDYAPHVFRDVRRLCGITTPDYLASWSDPAPDQKLSQSSGRSGSMFYRTQDRRYFFKTLLHPEVGVMMDMLKDYHQYLIDAPKNFIMRVVGLYRLTYSPAKQIWVLVFKNVFPPGVAIDETYDLKGRKPKRSNTPVVGGGPVKDNQIQRQIYFSAPEVTQFYHDQLNQDIDFLMKHNVMDYSLLVGVHYVTDEERRVHESKDSKDNTKDASKQSPEATHHSSTSSAEQVNNTNQVTPVTKSRSSSSSSSSSSSVSDKADTKKDDKTEDNKKDDTKTEDKKSDEKKSDDKKSGKDKSKTDKKSGDKKSNKEDKTEEPKKTETAAPVQDVFELGGFAGTNPSDQKQEIYFIGIIDCLTSYVLKKKVANLLKKIVWDEATLSTVRADYYAKRFRYFMVRKLVHDPSRPVNERDSISSGEEWSEEDNSTRARAMSVAAVPSTSTSKKEPKVTSPRPAGKTDKLNKSDEEQDKKTKSPKTKSKKEHENKSNENKTDVTVAKQDAALEVKDNKESKSPRKEKRESVREVKKKDKKSDDKKDDTTASPRKEKRESVRDVKKKDKESKEEKKAEVKQEVDKKEQRASLREVPKKDKKKDKKSAASTAVPVSAEVKTQAKDESAGTENKQTETAAVKTETPVTEVKSEVNKSEVKTEGTTEVKAEVHAESNGHVQSTQHKEDESSSSSSSSSSSK